MFEFMEMIFLMDHFQKKSKDPMYFVKTTKIQTDFNFLNKSK